MKSNLHLHRAQAHSEHIPYTPAHIQHKTHIYYTFRSKLFRVSTPQNAIWLDSIYSSMLNNKAFSIYAAYVQRVVMRGHDRVTRAREICMLYIILLYKEILMLRLLLLLLTLCKYKKKRINKNHRLKKQTYLTESERSSSVVYTIIQILNMTVLSGRQPTVAASQESSFSLLDLSASSTSRQSSGWKGGSYDYLSL